MSSLTNTVKSGVLLDGNDSVVDEVCTLIPGMFGLAIQFLLCIISILILLIKYMFEVPRRSRRVFIMDFIQLMCGSSTVHILNIISSILINRYRLNNINNNNIIQDECNMYFMTTLFDATIGVYIEYKIIKYLAIRRVAYNYLQNNRKSKFTPTLYELADATRFASINLDIQSYNNDLEDISNLSDDDDNELLIYNNNNNTSFIFNNNTSFIFNKFNHIFNNFNHWSKKKSSKEFLHNLYTWFIIVSGLKFASIIIFIIFSYHINLVAAYLLNAFNKTHRLKLIFVMIISPLFFNIFQYYVTDSIIKIKIPLSK